METITAPIGQLNSDLEADKEMLTPETGYQPSVDPDGSINFTGTSERVVYRLFMGEWRRVCYTLDGEDWVPTQACVYKKTRRNWFRK